MGSLDLSALRDVNTALHLPRIRIANESTSPRSVWDTLVRQNVHFATASSKTVTPEVEDALCSVIAFINQFEEWEGNP